MFELNDPRFSVNNENDVSFCKDQCRFLFSTRVISV